MSTFDETVKTATRTNASASDKDLPDLGSLDPNNMTSAAGLGGTTGVDSKLIHGDRWQEIKGNLTENIAKNLKTNIDKIQRWTVHEDSHYTIDGKTYNLYREEAFQWFHSDSLFDYLGEHTDHHHAHDHLINPTHTFNILNIEGDYKNVDLALKSMAIDVKGISTEASVTKAEVWGAGAEAWFATVAAGFFKNEACHIDVQEKELDAKIDGMKPRLVALDVQVGGPRTLIMPVRVGICIAIHTDSPWA